ncbi:MAG: bifunctional proline dehydrogenase/L-glutamate gamma-semialdehyde dehydrogenase PutA [Pseudomonadota bacterium]
MAALVDVSGRSRPTSDLPSRTEISQYHLLNESRLVGGLIERAIYTEDERRRTTELATRLVNGLRADDGSDSGVDAFMKEYGFSTEEGIILMCLAEALLRIPDSATADALIADKIGSGRWEQHLGSSESLLVNASTWGLLLTGRIVNLGKTKSEDSPTGLINNLLKGVSEPVVRQALRQAMRMMGDQFVLGRTIQDALKRARGDLSKGYRYSYDMLGEAAMTMPDAERYYARYLGAIEAVARANGPLFEKGADSIFRRPSVSIKLTALHPRVEAGRETLLDKELLPRLIELVRLARNNGLGLTIDAEEQDRLDVLLGLFGKLLNDVEFKGWNGLGLAVQAYSKRAIPVLRWLRRMAHQTEKKIPVRLVKGAYWDSEIKWAQEQGLPDYPVFTRKLHTDVSYLACARFMLNDRDAFYPQFATHNAQTLSAIAIAGRDADFEFQRLHGMGDALYDQVMADDAVKQPCRIYAPVGEHEDLLAYLVRRLLENGANTSFVNRLSDEELPVEQLVADPLLRAEAERQVSATERKPELPRPPALFGEERRNSLGLALAETAVRDDVMAGMGLALQDGFDAHPLISGEDKRSAESGDFVFCPHDKRQRLGRLVNSSHEDIEQSLAAAHAAQMAWDQTDGEQRAQLLEACADLYERNCARLMAIIVREAGKTLENALGDVREAVDFLRYYAVEARRLFGEPQNLKGVTGETNLYGMTGRGPFACISPWNFPLAIFTGQIAGALAAGNCVLAKPAEQTPLTAFAATQLFYEAGMPRDVLQLLPGDGATGAALVSDPRVRGVAFTGSNETAWRIQRALVDRKGEIIPFIAETGGINAMIADSSALPEQVTRDIIKSAFDSAGQRCSATRVLFLQDDVADKMIEMLVGATEILSLGDPMDYATDVGPVIDAGAQDALDAHKANMYRDAKVLVDLRLPDNCHLGTYVTPAIFEIGSIKELKRETFGPILHIVRYAQSNLDKVCSAIQETGSGLTLGIHSRIESTVDEIVKRTKVGNTYVNRNQIGAVVGVQPFGGVGLSGTGPKAGGPNYLARFACERVITNNITATGGNVELLSL